MPDPARQPAPGWPAWSGRARPTIEQVSDRRLGIPALVTLDCAPPVRGLEPKRAAHLQRGITWDVSGILDRWAHPVRAGDTLGEATLIKWWLLKVSGPLPCLPAELGEFVTQVSFCGARWITVDQPMR